MSDQIGSSCSSPSTILDSVRLETDQNVWIGNFTEEVSHIINNPSKLSNIFRLSSKDTEIVSALIWAKRFELEENKTVRIDHQKII